MDIQDMRIFARVAAVQNLSAVGTELGLTPGTISKRIQALEDELSARLFDRTTRSIRITEEGATFLGHVERILAEIEAARASVDDKVSKPKGKLKIAAPACLGRRYVAPALCEFMRDYPEIEVQVDLQDRPVNLQEDGYDMAIRTGALSNSSADRQAPGARPACGRRVAGLSRPRRAGRCAPEDLSPPQLLDAGRPLGSGRSASNGAETTVRVGGTLRSNNGELLCQAALDGNGLDPRVRARGACRSCARASSCRCCPTTRSAAMSRVWALYPSSKHMLPRMRVLLDFLAEWFRDARGKPTNGSTRKTPMPQDIAAKVRVHVS